MRFSLPPPERTGVGWVLASAAVNFAFIAFLVWLGYQPPEEREVRYIVLDPPPSGIQQYDMTYVPPQPGDQSGDARLGAVSAAGRRLARSVAPLDASPVEVVTPPLRVPRSVREVGVDEAGREVVIGSRRLGPTFGDGRAWAAAPLTAVEKVEIALRVMEVDSGFRERLIEMIEALPPDSFAYADTPSWVADFAGGTWGVDQQWIHLGGIKIPTALLALLPFPQGNIFQAREAQRYEMIRQEIINTARRQEDMEDIRKAIEELRKRRDVERDALRDARRDSVIARDTIIK